MSGRQFVFSLLFKGDAAGAKAAASEAKAAVEAVSAETQASASVTEKDTVSQKQNAQARREVAAAAKEQAEAEKRAKEAAQRGIGGTGSPISPVPGPAPSPALGNVPPVDLEALKQRYVPIYAAQKAYEAELEGISKAEQAGALTAAEAAAAQGRLRAGYDRTTESLRRADAALSGTTGQMKLQGHEARILAMQANDTFQSLALGMSPLQVLLQQGPQVVDILGGWGRTMQFLRQSLTGMRVLMGGTAAAVIAGAMAWDQYLTSTKAVEIAAAGRGAALGVTAGQLNRTAALGADQANLSIGDSRTLVAQLASSGQIGPQNLEGVLGISSDFAVTMGVEADAVGGKLIEMFAKPGEAAENLRKTNFGIRADTVEQIQLLEAQNRKFEAQAVLLAALEERMVDAGKAQSAIGRGWGAVKRGLSNAFDAGGSLLDETYETGNLAQVLNPNPMGMAEAAFDIYGSRRDAAVAASQEDRAAAAKAPILEANRQGEMALSLAQKASTNATHLKIDALQAEVVAMTAGQAAADLSTRQRELITSAIEGQANALDALVNRHQRALGMAQLDLQIATERNPMRRAELISLQAMNRAYNEGADAQKLWDTKAEARAAAVNEIIAGTANQAAAMMEEASAREQLNALVAQGAVSSADASGWLERELALRPLLAAAATAEGKDKARLEEEIRKLIAGYDALNAARRQEMVDADGKAADGRIAQLRLEASLIGQSAAARTRALAVAEAERRMRTIGIEDMKDPRVVEARKKALDEANAQIERDRIQRQADLRNQLTADASGASARLARNPIDRAEIEAQAAYAAAIAQTGDADEAAARAAQVRSRALAELRGAMADMAVEQEAQMDRLRLEASLLGLSEQARTRAMAAYEADLKMRSMGMDLASAEAQDRRDAAVRIADQQREIEGLADAWDKVRSAAEGAIDAPIDALLNGDLKGALLEAVKGIADVWTELAWKNPLKNRLMGTDYTTIDDMGGLGGILGQLFGGQAPTVTASAMNAASMAVTTPMVTLNAANLNGMPGGVMGAGSNVVPFPSAMSAHMPAATADLSILQSVAQGGALRPDALTGLQGPFAGQLAGMVTDAQALFGAEAVKITSAFRSVERQAELWAAALAKYGSEAEARKWVAPPGHSNHNRGMAADLSYGSPAVQDWFHANAANYGLGFRMGNEPWHIEPSKMGGNQATKETSAAMTQLAGTTAQAQTQLHTLGAGAQQLGTGMQQLGAGLAGTLQGIGASYGPGGALIGGLLGEGLKWIMGGGAAASAKPSGYISGGWTGPGATTDVAGVVHAEEYVFDAASTRKIGVSNLEAMRRGALRGYREGGYVVGGRAPFSASAASAKAGAATARPAAEMHINVSGTGNREIQEGVQMAVRAALEEYDRQALPDRVRAVVNDRWGG